MLGDVTRARFMTLYHFNWIGCSQLQRFVCCGWQGVLTLKNTYLEPRYVLLLPETRDGHERRLLEKGVYTAEQVRLTLDRAEFYAHFNAEHPGFFDTTVFAGTVCHLLHVLHVHDFYCS